MIVMDVSVGSSIRGGYACLGAGQVYGNSVLSTQFFSEPKTALKKNKVLIFKKKVKEVSNFRNS